jgi:hypothetical protein
MTPKEFAQMVYDSWDLTIPDFAVKYGLKSGDIMDDFVMEEALKQGAVSPYPPEE